MSAARIAESAAFVFAVLSCNACTLLVCHLDLFVASLRVRWQPTVVMLCFDQTERAMALVDVLLPFIVS